MIIENARYENPEQTLIRLTLDGVEAVVPTDVGNIHYQLLREAGVSVGQYTAPTRTAGTFGEFMSLFTADEQIAIASASNASAQIKLWYDQAVATNMIDLSSALVQSGVDALVYAKLLTPARRDTILRTNFDA